MKERKVIKGIAASSGRVKGKVIIIKSLVGIPKVKEVEVLVVPFLTPGIVPLMLTAKAVVSDHGGITSHAANIARELGIPCVAATTVATKDLVDGDIVEVDGDKGFVRII